MKRTKNSIKAGILGMMALLGTACSESLDEINESPNSLVDTEVDIKFVLTGVISKSAEIQAQLCYDWGEITAATQYLQRDFTSYEENNYQWGPVDYNTFYEPLKDSQYVYERAQNEKEGSVRDFYQGVALIMKAYHFGFLTSAFGDVPFHDALQAELGGDRYFNPVYDTQEEVFAALLNDLATANTLLSTVDICEEAVDSDIMYQGNGQQWRRLANSLRLRYLMRLSNKTGSSINAANEFAAIVNNANEHPVIQSNANNATIAFVGTDENNSWPGGALHWSNRSEFYRRKPSATIVNTLTALEDPRLTAWVRPVDVQLAQGTADAVVLEDNRVKRYLAMDIDAINNDANLENDIDTHLFVGLGVALNAPNDYNLGGTISTVSEAVSALDPSIYFNAAANPHVSYLTAMYADNANDGVQANIMTAAEVSFLLAEASIRGWIGQNAYTHFANGIAFSLDQYAITDGAANAVYDVANNGLKTFDQSAYMAMVQSQYTTASNPLEVVMQQKWIAMWLTAESWFDWRRTGFPNLTENIISGTNGQQIPLRFIYSDSYNENHMLEAIDRLSPATNDQWSRMWLLQ